MAVSIDYFLHDGHFDLLVVKIIPMFENNLAFLADQLYVWVIIVLLINQGYFVVL